MSRYQASLVHLFLSALLVGSVVGVVFWLWYPEPTFGIVGVLPIILMLIAIDLVLGPLLTMIVYKHGKPGLKFDLSVIALVQIVALAYGTHILYQEKPHYLVFAVDRLEFVAKTHIDPLVMRFEESQTEKFAGLTLVYARRPTDPDEYQRYFDSVIFEGQPDLERRPEFWEPWSGGADMLRQQAKAIEDITAESPLEQENLRRAIEEHASNHPNLGLLPIGGIEANIGMLVDRDTLEIIDVIYANPWRTDES
jgi:hypothetical protein